MDEYRYLPAPKSNSRLLRYANYWSIVKFISFILFKTDPIRLLFQVAMLLLVVFMSLLKFYLYRLLSGIIKGMLDKTYWQLFLDNVGTH